MKKLLKILLTICLVLVSAFSLFACAPTKQTGETGLMYKKLSGEDFYTVYKYVDETGVTTLDIDAEIKELTGDDTAVVGRIALSAFAGNKNLTSVIVPTTVTEIGAGAFAKMKSLNKITLPFVGRYASADVACLNDPATFPDHNPDAPEKKSIGVEKSFAYIFGTESYAYGAKVTANYGQGTADYYIPANLTEVEIVSNANYRIPMNAFAGINLISKITLCENVTEIGVAAFAKADSITSITIPASVTKIYDSAFEGNAYLETVNFASSGNLAFIGKNAFKGAGLEGELTIPDSVSEIGDYAFSAVKITKLNLPATQIVLGNCAFYGCTELVTVTNMPGAFTTSDVFGECEKLVIA